MIGFAGDKEEEPSDELNVGPERRERSRCCFLGVETEHLGEWEDGERKEMGGFSLEPVTFAVTELVFCDDLVLYCGAVLPTPMLGDLQFKGP